MLKKSNTKFAYWRKVFALPLLFMLVFAYMVKAENREIKTINNSYQENLVTIKNDTIRSQNLQPIVLDSTNSKTKDSFDFKEVQPLRNFNDVFSEVKEVVAEARKINGPIIYSTELKDNLKNEIIKIDTLKPKNKTQKFNGKKKSVLKTYKTVTYYLNGKQIDYSEFDKLAPKEIKELDTENLKSIYISTIKGKEPNVENYTGTSYFIPSDKSTLEAKAIASKENQYIFTNPAITPPQSKYNVTQPTKNVRYISSMSYVTDEGSDETKTILGTPDYTNAKVYINGKISDEKTAKALKPNNIKRVNVKRNNNNGVEKNEVRITTKR